MRRILKYNIIADNSGESMAEVLVAFTLLSIMLVIFFEGVAWAKNTEVNASKNRDRTDQAMIDLQTKCRTESGTEAGQVANLQGRISRKVYVVDGYTYVLYEAQGVS